jgi:hypothetical protein
MKGFANKIKHRLGFVRRETVFIEEEERQVMVYGQRL